MPTVGELYQVILEKAPLSLKQDFDNVGLLVGCRDWLVDTVLLSLDITDAVVQEAADLGAGLVLSHHPLFFELKSVTDETPQGRRAARLLQSRIAAICMHTNLDAAEGGVNDALARLLGVRDAAPFEHTGIGRLGTLAAPMPLAAFLPQVKAALGAAGLRYVDSGRPVHRLALGGGSCGFMLEEAAQAGCDTLLTADVKYDVFLRARELGVSLIDGGHFCTENVVLPVLADWLRAAYPAIRLCFSSHSQPERFFV